MEEVNVQTNVTPLREISPTIYAYTTPEIDRHKGWTKIGYTEAQTAEERIAQQAETVDVKTVLEWDEPAVYKTKPKEYFKDRHFHRFLEKEGEYKRGKNEHKRQNEWFKIDPETAHEEFERFARHTIIKNDDGNLEYVLRDEQERAVDRTMEYFEGDGQEFLWNAKPRFGKTLAAYDLIQRLGYERVLIVTNRPSIANAWREDYVKFVGWRGEYAFVSENEAVRDKKGVMSRDEYTKENRKNEELKMIAFESLPSLKGARAFGGDYDKLEWMAQLEFDLLVIDEAHEGVDTEKTDVVLDNISAAHILHLSGTPFKALANQKFGEAQIFNWSYADEQEAKENYAGEDWNPYEVLPKLSMYSYQISEMMAEEVRKGADLMEDETVDYAFDLAEFFKVNSDGSFKYEVEVRNFLDALTTQEKYPFSTPELRDALSHTLWYMNRIDSVRALARMLRSHPVFKDYKIVEAVGKSDDSFADEAVEAVDDDRSKKSLDKVREAIEKNDKTITLSVGQLTVGVTVPEWSGVMMLCNLKSPAAYMQAAFRAQNPYETSVDGRRFRKENAYVFDFDPTRTLKIFDEFANNLIAGEEGVAGGEEERKKNISRLLNFFPVIGEDEEGRMIELDAADVLSIPRRLMSQEVVRRGFMDNFLFQNIAGIFNAPAVIKDILGKIAPSSQGKIERKKPVSTEADGIEVDKNGEPVIPNEKVIGTAADMFGEKVYETVSNAVKGPVSEAAETSKLPPKAKETKMREAIDKATRSIVDAVSDNVLDKAAEEYELKNQTKNSVKKQIAREAKAKLESVRQDYEKETAAALKRKNKEEQAAATDDEKKRAWENYELDLDQANRNFANGLRKAAEAFVEQSCENVVEKIEKAKAKEKIKSATDDMRAHLRGFARTIPSFLMAYGDDDLTLQNFDSYLEEEPFEEITGITIRDFRLLRDGGVVRNEETGKDEIVSGHYFNEGVFNDSIKEFLKKKRKLADYFDESQKEDIFDYIPPQKTNQIFTPKWVVRKMLDVMEEENPGCFDDPDSTFADLYMKSGIYIAEIIKRLYRSSGLKEAYPDEKKRLRHILDNQVYGMAPTRVIYLIATNYILGFDEELADEHPHFAQADAQKASVKGTLQDLVDETFGE